MRGLVGFCSRENEYGAAAKRGPYSKVRIDLVAAGKGLRMSAGDSISYELEGLGDRDAFLPSAFSVLLTLLPADAVSWWDVPDVHGGEAQIAGMPCDVYQDASLPTRLLNNSVDHPMILSYLRDGPGDPHRPRRLSDLTSRADLHRTQTYNEVLRPMGNEYQLTVLTKKPSRQSGRMWVFGRASIDFSDVELALAGQLQAVLCALDRDYDSQRRIVESPADKYRLSERESEVLCKLAQGHTAATIGRLLRISPATVRKHVQHVYDKLGTRDRLGAVMLAYREGLIL